LNRLIRFLAARPTTLIGVDSIGALLSGTFLFLISKSGWEYFGLPTSVYSSLAAFAFALMVFSGVGFLLSPRQLSFFIRMAMSLNGAYILYTVHLLSQHGAIIAPADFAYFFGEMGVLIALIIAEYRAYRRLTI
jgi:hypothetical protein